MLELARPGDREAVNRINQQVHAIHVAWRPDIYEMADDLYPEPFFLEDIQERRIYVAKISGVVVGYVTVQLRDFKGPGIVSRKVLMLEEFAVEETCRNQGIDSEMMRDVEALARAFGCTDIQLSVQPQNDAAIALYRRFGFTIRNINMQRKI